MAKMLCEKCGKDYCICHYSQNPLEAENVRLRADIELLRKGQPITRADLREEGRLKDKIQTLELQVSELQKACKTLDKKRSDLEIEKEAYLLQNQELQNENARLKRNCKCAGCGHTKENHDSNECLVWVEADAGRKCLCKVWTDTEKRNDKHQCICDPGRRSAYCKAHV